MTTSVAVPEAGTAIASGEPFPSTSAVTAMTPAVPANGVNVGPAVPPDPNTEIVPPLATANVVTSPWLTCEGLVVEGIPAAGVEDTVAVSEADTPSSSVSVTVTVCWPESA